MAREQLIPLSWPSGGVVENSAFYSQPPLTSTDALNVRNYDVIGRRSRGGQRPGLEKYITTAVNGSSTIQTLGSVVLAFDSTSLVADTLLIEQDFTTFADGVLTTINPDWVAYDQLFDNLDVADTPQISSGELIADTSGALSQSVHYAPTTALVPGSKYVIRWRAKTNALSGASPLQVAFRMHDSDPITNNTFLMVSIRLVAGNLTAELWNQDGSNQTLATGSSNINALVSGPNTDYQDYELQVNGDTMRLLVNNVEAWTAINTNANTQAAFGITVGQNVTVSNFKNWSVYTAITPATLRTTELVTVSGGTIKHGNKTNGLATPTNGSSAQKTTGVTTMVDAFQKVYFADGLADDYKILDAKTSTVSNWKDSITAGALPAGVTGTQYNITAVDTSAKTFTVGEDVSSVFSAGSYLTVIDSSKDSSNENRDNNRTYTVVSTSGSGPTVITVNQTPQSSIADGTLGVGVAGGTILARFRGRVFIAGLETDPHNWFASASGDPNDWEYFPTVTSATQAIAGNNGELGKVGDVVTALAPYNDDTMIMGGANSLHVMRGDPAAGGAIDTISPTIGIVGPRAWVYDPSGNFYFFGADGLYRMDLNSFQPILISQDKLDKTFADINTATDLIILAYDIKRKGVQIFVSPEGQPSTAQTHYFFDVRNQAFWPEQYPIAFGPIAVHQFNADNPEENALLCGGYDSIIRNLSDSVKDDDGTLINSFCRFTPIVLGSVFATQRIRDIVAILDNASDDVTLKIYTGDTPETAEDNADSNTVRVKRTLKAGRNNTISHRVAQNALIIELSQNGVSGASATWALEQMAARGAVLSRVRGRGV